MRVAFAGGGTGGHIVPGLHLVSRSSSSAGAPALEDLLWFTSGRAVEDRILAGLPAELEWERVKLDLEPPSGGAPSRLRLLSRTLPAVLQCRRALRRHRSAVLLGLGGFTSLPAALAARSLGIPIALLEINAAPGQATRVLTPLARRVLHAWPGTLPAGREDRRHRTTGAPVAAAVIAARLDEERKPAARSAQGFAGERPLLLVLGGSQGADSLNHFVREQSQSWLEGGLQVWHQCGPGKRAQLGAERSGLRVEEFISDMAGALAAASLVLCRGGASTLAEVAAAAVPAWVVPYPGHADRHQERNAEQLGGGVRIVQDADLGPDLAAELAQGALEGGRQLRAGMRDALAASAQADAALEILLELESLAGR